MLTHANSHQATDPTDHATMSERALAAKVIQQAILDFVSTPPEALQRAGLWFPAGDPAVGGETQRVL